MGARVLLPLKDLVDAKSRLGGLLRPSERRALAQAMVEDVLTVLGRHPRVERVTLVSDDPGAGLLAARYGLDHWPESGLGCRGLNRVVARACERLHARGDGPLLVLHGDLPCLSEADISAALALLERGSGLVVGCDRHGSGTNLLAFQAGQLADFCFGSGSCERHIQAGRFLGLVVAVLRRPGIGLDIDEPADLALLLERVAPGHCAGLLAGTPLGRRIATQLASMNLSLDSEVKQGATL